MIVHCRARVNVAEQMHFQFHQNLSSPFRQQHTRSSPSLGGCVVCLQGRKQRNKSVISREYFQPYSSKGNWVESNEMLPLCGPFRHEPMKNWASFIRINQNCNKNFERDWLSPARFEHLQDSVRVMLVIGHCRSTVKGTINTSCLWKWRERVMRAFVWHFAELTRCCFFMKTY